ncbi:hypothetical protein [Crocosphaera sp.]|uniref:hypothetical protein n=1 Tax=Crocosphaera sp. TaxID=2729996 RepID=UPI003F23543D|nr:hypothetical protein [Crocosphaera sp.]
MSHSFPMIKSLKRLNVIDGLEITAERWKIAHQYHRQRQNIYYQSLHQPGIVHGLGVCVIPPPKDKDVSPQHRNHRWVQIQPGFAIDSFGDLIVVPKAENYYIYSQIKNGISRLIYLVIRYVDPDELKLHNKIEIEETFRIEEQNNPPQAGEIELCRIQLEGEEIVLKSPKNVFEPTANCLDVRYRQQAQTKPLSLISIAVLPGDAEEEQQGLNRLLKSIKGLDSTYEGYQKIRQISTTDYQENNHNYDDVLFLSQQRSQQLSSEHFSFLQSYLNKGGIILTQISTKNTKLEELKIIEHQLLIEIERIENTILTANKRKNESQENSDYLTRMYPILKDELTEIKKSIIIEVDQLSFKIEKLAEKLNISLETWEELSGSHPLKNEPFLFQKLPTINNQSLQLLVGQGLIIIIGDMVSIFSDNQQNLSREIIRNNQELMLNILKFGYDRKQMQQALQKPLENQ